MTYYTLSAVLNMLTGLGVGVAVLWQSRGKGKNLVCGFLSLFVGLWGLFYFLWQTAPDGASALFYDRVLMFWAIFLPPLFLHFIAHVADAVERNRLWIRAGYVVAAVLAASDFTPFFIRTMEPRGGFPFWPVAGPGFHAYVALFTVYVIRAALVLSRAEAESTGVRRRRMMYSWAVTGMIFAGGWTNFPLVYGVNFPPVGNILASFSVVHLMLLHTGTFTRRIVITSSYVLLLGFVGVGMFVAWRWGRPIVPADFREGTAAALFAVAGAAAPFFYQRFQRMVDRACHPEYCERAEKLALLERRLLASSSLREFNATLLSGVQEVFGAAEAWLADGAAAQLGSAGRVVVPLKADKLSAALVLGPKESGLSYSDQEIDEVSAFARLGAIVSKVDQLQESRSTLQKDVETKTEELRLAQALLLRSERLAAIGEMSSVVSHELKTPLTVILNSLFFLRRKDAAPVDEKSLKHLENVEKQARVLKNIISDILDYARDRAPTRMEGDLAAEIRRLCETMPVPANVRLEADLPEGLPPVSFDAMGIGQALSNLLTNAFQAMPEGGAVKVAARPAGEDAVEVLVSDGGCGIPPQDMKKIFEPFFTTKNRGTGLGLAVVKKVVDGHGGTIEVRSRPGAGTDVFIRLPASRVLAV